MKFKLTKHISNELIEKLSQLVENDFSDLFLAAVVHGSVASNEIIQYSDFDGLLIVKDQHHGSKTFNKFISKSMKLIYQFDPLQHHGWFVIKESELSAYPQTYFPHELFEFSSLIYPQTIELEIELLEKIDYSLPFQNLCVSLEKKIKQNFKPKNDYQLKSYLSEIMLLPTFFLQAKFKKGIYKKDSFKLIQTYIEQEFLIPIDIASNLRLEWSQKSLSLMQKLMLHLLPINIFKKLNEKFWAPKINSNISGFQLEKLNHKLALLLNKMRESYD